MKRSSPRRQARITSFVGIAALAAVAGCAASGDEAGGGGGAGGRSATATTLLATTGSFALAGATQSASQNVGVSVGVGDTAHCPNDVPTAGETCIFYGIECGFGKQQCLCENQWSCVECPLAEPSTGEECATPSTDCHFGPLTCHCLADGWDCGTCPEPAPDDQSNCDTPGLQCDYRVGLHCACSSGLWTCAAPCPATTPDPGSACSNGESQECDYDSTSCFCIAHQFFCN